MNRLLAGIIAVLIGVVMAIPDAEAARRAAGGKNAGAQRDGVTQRQAAPQQGAPAQQAAPAQAAPAAPAAAGAAAAAAKPGMGRWLAPLAGLAIGLGLASLFGEQLGSILMAVLLAVAAIVAIVFVMRMLSRNRGNTNTQPGALRTAEAGAGYGSGSGDGRPLPRIGEGLGGAAAAAPVANAAVPAGFDVQSFLQQAKGGFLALQEANDRGDIEALRDMTSDEMYAVLKRDFDARGGVPQRVEVITLDADLLEVVTEGPVHWASVRFSGTLREEAGAAPEPFTEIWNLQKPTDGSSGWLVAGIQQVN